MGPPAWLRVTPIPVMDLAFSKSSIRTVYSGGSRVNQARSLPPQIRSDVPSVLHRKLIHSAEHLL